MVNRSSTIVTLMFLPVLALTCLFFGIKFYEFIVVAIYEPDGAFAVTPIMNYLLAGLGFLCMLGWATYNGMFHDIERPKITMLENEARLDALEQHSEGRDQKGTP
ncbi:MAG: hypothetical protein AB7G28_13295 [Pirellulales bacterium]